jgi:hypothetical protein
VSTPHLAVANGGGGLRAEDHIASGRSPPLSGTPGTALVAYAVRAKQHGGDARYLFSERVQFSRTQSRGILAHIDGKALLFAPDEEIFLANPCLCCCVWPHREFCDYKVPCGNCARLGQQCIPISRPIDMSEYIYGDLAIELLGTPLEPVSQPDRLITRLEMNQQSSQPESTMEWGTNEDFNLKFASVASVSEDVDVVPQRFDSDFDALQMKLIR